MLAQLEEGGTPPPVTLPLTTSLEIHPPAVCRHVFFALGADQLDRQRRVEDHDWATPTTRSTSLGLSTKHKAQVPGRVTLPVALGTWEPPVCCGEAST